MEVVMKMTSRLPVLVVEAVGVSVCVMACSSPPPRDAATTKPQPPAAQAQQKQYELKGKVVAVDKDGKKVSVAGEDIPGFMSAMTMSYPVKNERLLENLSPGDQIAARLVADGSEYYLEQITVVPRNP